MTRILAYNTMTGAELASALLQLQITTSDLSRRFRVSDRTVARWLAAGTHGPPIAAVRALLKCKEYGIAY